MKYHAFVSYSHRMDGRLAAVLQRFRPWLVPGHPVAPETLITLRPRWGLQMGLTPVAPVPAAAE